jgi:hypothetical protein
VGGLRARLGALEGDTASKGASGPRTPCDLHRSLLPLAALREVDLEGNRLCDLSFLATSRFPGEQSSASRKPGAAKTNTALRVATLPKLRSLNVNGNQIAKLSVEKPLAELQELFAAGNRLELGPDGGKVAEALSADGLLEKLPRLEILDVSGTSSSAVNAEALVGVVRSCFARSLVELYCSVEQREKLSPGEKPTANADDEVAAAFAERLDHFFERGSQRINNSGTKWEPNGRAVLGQTGINQQLVDAIRPCSEG